MTSRHCLAHDPDDGIPDRICGHREPCPEHPRGPYGTPRKRRSGTSGPTQSTEDRLAAGRRRLFVWLTTEAAERLERLAKGRTKAQTIARALELLDSREK